MDQEKKWEKLKDIQLRLFIDTAEVEEIREAVKTGVVAGIAMNPGKIAQTGREKKGGVSEGRGVFFGPKSVQGVDEKKGEIVKKEKKKAKMS